eukprot:TRINITY_DN32281_c0_g1_i1.p1 TRINITY_DN32281_c0_g1~~TRINITY_DN32281_c0_g1_i1.p1  ORF type:complete len:1369 (-),score=275.65 TRINITY_DN32281_c0_g1_i1:67-4173(-)
MPVDGFGGAAKAAPTNKTAVTAGQDKTLAKAAAAAPPEKKSLLEEAQQAWADDARDERLRHEHREMNLQTAKNGVKPSGNRKKGLADVQKLQNKLKFFKGECDIASVVKDMDGVDASKFVPELADAILEAAGVTVKLKELFSVVKVCGLLNGMYEEFRGALSKALDKAFSSAPATELNRRRFLLRLCIELCLVECIPSDKSPLVKIVQSLSDIKVFEEEEAIASFAVLTSLVQKHAVSCLKLIPGRQKTYEEALGKSWVTRSCVLDGSLQVKLLQLISNAYLGSAASLLQRTYSQLRQQERENSRAPKGQFSAELELKLQQVRERFEKLQSNLTVLAESLNHPLPTPRDEDMPVVKVQAQPKPAAPSKPVESESLEQLIPKGDRKDQAKKGTNKKAKGDKEDQEDERDILGQRTSYQDVMILDEAPETKTNSKKGKREDEPDDELQRMMIMRAKQAGESEQCKLSEKITKSAHIVIEATNETNKSSMPRLPDKEVINPPETEEPVDAPSPSPLATEAADHPPRILAPDEALRQALVAYDVDEDTFESLLEMVSDASASNQDDAQSLAKSLEESLEPFMLAFGAEPEDIPSICLKMAVSIVGTPKSQTEDARATDAVIASQPSKPKSRPDTLVSLEAVCKLGTAVLSGYPKQGNTKAKAKPKALGELLGSTAGATAFDINGAFGGGDHVDSDEEDRPKQLSAAESAKLRREEARARRIALAEAKANKPLIEENLGNVAAHGLKETQNSVSTDSAKSHNRRVHVEGTGSKNIHLEDVTLEISGDQGSIHLLKSSDLHLSAGQIYGLVGRNGSGKTTLLRRLAARAVPGMPQHLRFGYVAQELAALQGEQTALEAVVNSDEEINALLSERAKLEELLDGAQDLKDAKSVAEAEAHAQRFTEIEQELEALEADAAEDRARQMLEMLAFNENLMNQPLETMSGGWRMRVALACALTSRNDVLLLDEPTNHLDLHGVLWLQKHLYNEWGEGSKKKDRIVVIVSHDRSFLDNCATNILEIHDCKLRTFTGNYSTYLDKVSEEQRLALLRREEAERQDKAAMQELKAMKKVARQHKDEKKVRQLKSREKKIEKTSSSLCSAREFGTDANDIMTKLREDPSLRFRFPEVAIALDDDTNYLEVDNASIRLGGKVILSNVVITVSPGSRIAIVGPNGAGKSTLMKALAGELQFEEGPRGRGRRHADFKPGFVSQNHLENQASGLHHNCVNFLRAQLPDGDRLRGQPDMLTTKSDDSVLRALLGNFGMGRDAVKKVGYLSGGQKARLSMATSTWWGPNTLLLDEPTNHLDVDSLDALSIGLQNYEGAVIVVSHNQGFLNTLCDELWIVENGGVKVCPKGEEAFTEFFAKYVKQVEKTLNT